MMHIKERLKRLVIWISLLICNYSIAQSPEKLLEYSNECYKNEDYQSAIKLYSRIIFFEKEKYGSECFSKLATSHYKLGQYNEALNYYDLAYNTSNNDSIKTERIFEKILCYMQLKNYEYALIELFNLSDSLSKKNTLRKQFYEGSIYFLKEEFEKAKSAFEKINPNNNEFKQKLNEIFLSFEKENKFSVKRSKILSYILPGLGQAYSGDYKNSINSFLLTVGFVTIYLVVASTISPIEAIIGIGPWFQRYYQGGVKHSGLIAMKKKETIKNKYYVTIADFITCSSK